MDLSQPPRISIRPTSIGPAEQEVPVKLVPITGRVSRAKKGVPVHICDICKPPKTFTRAEQLRRHQLSHKHTPFRRNRKGCDKTHHRLDLFNRHALIHEHYYNHFPENCQFQTDNLANPEQYPSKEYRLNPGSFTQLSVDKVIKGQPTWNQERSSQIISNANPPFETRDGPSDSRVGVTTCPQLVDYNLPNALNSSLYNVYSEDQYRFPPASPITARLQREIERSGSIASGAANSGFDIATDSGYGSLGSVHRKSQMRDTIRTTLQGPATSTWNLRDDDNHTVYSDVQSLYQDKLEIYISEFAEELAAVLPRSISTEQLPGLSTALSSLLKAFAIKFGCEDVSHSQYRLMYLVHKYRNQISKAVIDTFTIEEQDTDEEVQKPNNVMPIQDKMLLWARKNDQVIDDMDHGAASTANVNIYQDNDTPWDDETGSDKDLMEDYPEINEYRQTLLNSAAYSWLLKSVIGEVELEIPAGVDDARGRIRKEILSFVHEPSKITQKSAPPMQRIVFRLPWIQDYLLSQEYNVPIHEALTHALVIVGVDDQTLVTSCVEYLETLWPDNGPQVLGLCINLLTNPNGLIAICRLFDRSLITANVDDDGSTVEVSVTGNVHSIAEISEIMAWFSAAFNCNSSGYDLIYRSPSCEICHPLSTKAPGTQHAPRALPSLNFTFDESPSRKPANADPQGLCWTNLFGNRSVVRGYPIPRRTAKGTGAEISLGLMAQLVGARKISNFAGSVLIKGSSAALVPTQRTEDAIIWHLVFDQLGGYLSYIDPKVKNTLKDSVKGLTRGDLEGSRHILGWCSSALNHAGAADANYSIGWSSLKPPAPGLAFEKISLVGGMFITAGVSTIIGKRDKAVHFRYRDDYTMRLKWVAKKFVVLYDVPEKRAWLLNGASALLHLVRASLQHDLNDPFKELCLYRNSAIFESFLDPYSGKDAAIRVLLNPQNLDIPIYAKPDAKRVETSIHQGREVKVASSTQTNYCLKDRIEDICNVLEQIMAHQADTCTQDGVGFKVKASDRRHIEGFDFMDIATDEDPCFPRQVTLRSSGRGWVDFVRSIHAVTLFGSSFGDLISPDKANTDACSSCYADMNLPRGQDLLAVCVSELSDILQKRGSKATTPWRLVDDIYWLTPDKTFEPCQPGQKCDRVQVLLPATFPKLWGRKFRSPGDLAQAPRGALIFGHSRRFPLRWGDRGEPEQGHADQDHNDMEGLQTSMQDSGIGSSVDSSSGNDAPSPPSTSSGSQSREGTRAPPVHIPERENESEQNSKRRRLNDYFSKLSR